MTCAAQLRLDLGVRLELTKAILNHVSAATVALPASINVTIGHPRSAPRWMPGPLTSFRSPSIVLQRRMSSN